MLKGQIVKILSNLYFVESNGEIFECRSRGKFRHMDLTPVVGDFVLFDEEEKYILEVLERKNVLVRPMVSNIDQAFIVTSVKQPDFSSYLLDKLLVLMYHHHIKPIICITKYDLLEKDERKEIDAIIKYYKKQGYQVIKNHQLFKIRRMFKGKTTVFTGQTGAGKSTLLNKLDKRLSLEVGEISKALGRGRHTTRHVELIHVWKGNVLDTPGFSSLDLTDISKEEIKDAFKEFERITCFYQDCFHLKEKECLVKEAVDNGKILASRYENYTRFLNERK